MIEGNKQEQTTLTATPSGEFRIISWYFYSKDKGTPVLIMPRQGKVQIHYESDEQEYPHVKCRSDLPPGILFCPFKLMQSLKIEFNFKKGNFQS